MAGIYQIRNLLNGKVYVGQTCNSFKERFRQHRRLLLLGKHTNRHLQLSVNKYGIEAFAMEAIFIIEDLKILNEVEESIINSIPKVQRYNIATLVTTAWNKGSGKSFLTRAHYNKLSENYKGVSRTDDVRQKISRSRKANPNSAKSSKQNGRMNRKIDMNDAREIRNLISRGVRQIDIAKQYNLTPRTIRAIRDNKRWAEDI